MVAYTVYDNFVCWYRPIFCWYANFSPISPSVVVIILCETCTGRVLTRPALHTVICVEVNNSSTTSQCLDPSLESGHFWSVHLHRRCDHFAIGSAISPIFSVLRPPSSRQGAGLVWPRYCDDQRDVIAYHRDSGSTEYICVIVDILIAGSQSIDPAPFVEWRSLWLH